jgi:hypothetical protein
MTEQSVQNQNSDVGNATPLLQPIQAYLRHELGTHLTIMIGYSQMLLLYLDNDIQECCGEKLEQLQITLMQMLDLVELLFDRKKNLQAQFDPDVNALKQFFHQQFDPLLAVVQDACQTLGEQAIAFAQAELSIDVQKIQKSAANFNDVLNTFDLRVAQN